MNLIHVQTDHSQYRIVRIPSEDVPELSICDSVNELVIVLRGMGVDPAGVGRVIDQLRDGDDAKVSV